MAKRVNNKEKIMSALLTCNSVREASQLTGISERTIWNARANEDFSRELEERRKNLLDSTCLLLQANIQSAVITASEIMKNPDNSPQVRLNACDLIIRNTCKLTDLTDNKARLDYLLRQLNELNIIDS